MPDVRVETQSFDVDATLQNTDVVAETQEFDLIVKVED